MMSGDGREAAGPVCKTDDGNASLNYPCLVFRSSVLHTARLRRAAGRSVQEWLTVFECRQFQQDVPISSLGSRNE